MCFSTFHIKLQNTLLFCKQTTSANAYYARNITLEAVWVSHMHSSALIHTANQWDMPFQYRNPNSDDSLQTMNIQIECLLFWETVLNSIKFFSNTQCVLQQQSRCKIQFVYATNGAQLSIHLVNQSVKPSGVRLMTIIRESTSIIKINSNQANMPRHQ